MTDPSQRAPVLVVDDDDAFCAAFASALRRRGLKVIVAHNYDEAMEEATAWGPDRAIVDLRMPGRNGLAVTAELKQRFPDIRIVVLTGYGSIATAVEAIKLGAIHYLTKPADVDDVLAAFDRTDADHQVSPPSKPMPLEEVEWQHLQQVLTDCDGNISEAARRLGLHRRTLQRKLARGPKPSG